MLFCLQNRGFFISVVICRASLVFTGLVLLLDGNAFIGLSATGHHFFTDLYSAMSYTKSTSLICTTAVKFNEDACLLKDQFLCAHASVLCHTVLVLELLF